MQRTWDKIKAYLSNWKTTNFGNGTYINTGSITINSKSRLSLNDASEIVLNASDLRLKGFGEIRIPLFGDSLTVTKGYGIALLYNQNISNKDENATITNNSGRKIRVIAISVTSTTGTSLRVQNKAVNDLTGENTASITLTSNVPTLIIWSTYYA